MVYAADLKSAGLKSLVGSSPTSPTIYYMTTSHELAQRELDPINDVRRRLEEFYTESYYNPDNGDWLSDSYWRIIDLTTQPGALTESDTNKLNQAIALLNDRHNRIMSRLSERSLIDAYVSVAAQVNTINVIDAMRKGVLLMEAPLLAETT